MPSTLKREDEIDQQQSERFNSVRDAEQAGYDREFADITGNYGNTADDSQENSNIKKVADAEKQQPEFINNTGKSEKSKGGKFRLFAKKSGPLGVVGLISLFGILGVGFLSPGLAIVQLKEIFTEDLNDQLTAMDIRSIHVMKAKLNDMGKGVCTGINIKCKFKGMSERQIKRFKAAGIEVNTGDNEKNSFTRKTKVVSLTLTDNTGKKIEVKNPRDARALLNDRNVRSQFRKAFNPKFAGFYDKVSAKVFARHGTSKASKLKGATEKERRDAITQTAKEGSSSVTDPDRITTTDDDGNKTETNDSEEARKSTERIRENSSGGFKSNFANGFKGAIRGVGALGVADSACTVKNVSRGIMASAKVIRKTQLIRYAMVFLTLADEIKAGTATPEQVETAGNILTATDTREKVYDETSDIKDGKATLVDNPYYGKGGFESEGYRTAAYNDAPTLTARSAQFMIGGAIGGRMANMLDIAGKAPGDTACKVIQNPVVRGLSFVGGVVAGIGSGGATIVGSIATSAAISLAIPILEGYLADMIAGETVSGDTEGVDSVNATFAGAAGVQGDIAMASGMAPASKEQIEDYTAQAQSVKSEYLAMEQEEAKQTPFDVYNQYSFAGSLSRKLLPSTLSLQSSIGALPSSGLKLLSTAQNSLVPTTSAAEEFNADRFSKCEDDGYDELEIDADIFCNVRYVMSDEELSLETDEVVDWMVDKGHITDDGMPDSDKYSEWLEECVERTAGWGEAPSEDESDAKLGKRCIVDDDGRSMDGDLSETELNRFRVYTMDNRIIEAMEYEGPAMGPGMSVMSYNILGEEQGNRNRNDGGFSMKKRADAAISIINEKRPAIIGFQEINKSQIDYFRGQLTSYDGYPAKSNGEGRGDSIWWDSSSLSLQDSGTYKIKKNGGKTASWPWVKLQSSSGGGTVYVFNIHPTAGTTGGKTVGARERKESTNRMLEEVRKVNTDGSPVVITGDFNSTSYLRKSIDYGISTSELPPNIITRSGYANTLDSAPQKTGDDYKSSHGSAGDKREPDKTSNRQNKIDHIFVSSGITVNTWENVIDENSRIASDHTPIIANLSIPGFTQAAGDVGNFESKDGWVWPIQQTTGLVAGPCYGGARVHAGMDINVKGLDVKAVAAHDGVVESTPTGGAGGNQIRVKVSDNLYYWYQHLKAPSPKKKGDTVKAGEFVGFVGRTGNIQVRAGYGHLHMVVYRKANDYPSYGYLGSSFDPVKVLPDNAPGGYKCSG